MARCILTDRSSRPGRNGVTMWRFTFYCLDDHLLYEMTVDNSYANWRRSGWDRVSEDAEPWGVYQDLRKTKRKTAAGMPIITADSPARLEHRLTQEECLRLIEAWERETNPTQFERLFGDDDADN